MNRRSFIQSTAASAAAALMPHLAFSQGKKGERPNVLFIAVDDQNDWMGCMGGHPDVITPNYDRLASRGVLFTNAHCSAPLCNASRASLMTGLRPSTTGVYDNRQPFREAAPDAVTLSTHFMNHGYVVEGSGKIYHGGFPDPKSWQTYWPSMRQPRAGDPMPDGRPLNGIPKTSHFDWGPVDVPDEEMGDWKVCDWVSGELGRNFSDPFFLACGIFRPHLPWYVPRKYFDMYPVDEITLPNVKDDDLDDVPPHGVKIARPGGDHKKVIETDNWRRAVQGYLASVSFADACLGRVLDALDAGPNRDNTIVVLWGDHGWHLGEKLHWRKFALWEEATHNPLMFVVPGVAQPGARCSRPVSLLDVYPTLADLCDLGPRDELEGNSLLPLLEDPNMAWEPPAVTTYMQNNHSVRSERWRYIRYHDGTEELYDHSRDEMEWTNLAGDAKYAAIKAEHARWLPTVNADPSPHAPKK